VIKKERGEEGEDEKVRSFRNFFFYEFCAATHIFRDKLPTANLQAGSSIAQEDEHQ
jgi:hypothetical protein